MKKTLKYYWERGNAWGRTFKGIFQISVADRKIIFPPHSTSNTQPMITITYEVLPLRQRLGVMKVSLEHGGQEYVGFVDLINHLSDPEIQRVSASQLAEKL